MKTGRNVSRRYFLQMVAGVGAFASVSSFCSRPAISAENAPVAKPFDAAQGLRQAQGFARNRSTTSQKPPPSAQMKIVFCAPPLQEAALT